MPSVSLYHTKEIRKCKCGNELARHITPEGRNKGFYRTCGSISCIKAQYTNPTISNKKRHIGKDHPLYKEDRTQIKSKRPQYENSAWTKSILERDNYTCQECGRRGVKLQAHHIMSYVDYIDLRWEISNGITLCIDCHKKTPNYAGRGRGKNAI